MRLPYQKCLAEFTGSFALVLFGCGSIAVGTLPDMVIPLIFGAIVATMIYTVGHISGAHFNPAVTLAFAVMRHFPVRQILPYWLSQCLGALAAIALLTVMLPAANSFGVTTPTITTGLAWLWEMLLSAFLMLVITAVATDTRAEGIMAGIAIGTIVTLCAYLGGPLTGASMNPARSLAPALFHDGLETLWIYLTAPCAGTLLGAGLYQLMRCDNKRMNAKGCC